jgi:hypothetical protein
MVNVYNSKKVQIERSDISNKEEGLRKIKSETAKEISKGIKVSVGAEVPGIGGFTTAIEYSKQKIFK